MGCETYSSTTPSPPPLHTRRGYQRSCMEKDGKKRVVFKVFEGFSPTPTADPTDTKERQAQQAWRHSGEQLEPSDTIQERAGKGI